MQTEIKEHKDRFYVEVSPKKGKPKYYGPYYGREYAEAAQARLQQDESARAEKRKERSQRLQALKANTPIPFKPGQVLYDCWGYDQTNIDWYLITDIQGRTATLQKIGGKVKETRFMSGWSYPDPTVKIGEAFTKPLQLYADNQGKGVWYIKSRHGWISIWTGGKKSCSWYA